MNLPRNSRKKAGEEFPRGNETILIVEDDKEVRNLAVRILKRQGYTVLDGSYGDKAFTSAGSIRDSIHLLVTDVVMPGMTVVDYLRFVALSDQR